MSDQGAGMVTSFKELEVYQLAEKLSDEIWSIVVIWDFFAKDTIGKQLVRAADSMGANFAEGTGRGSYRDNVRFITIARGSLTETQHWLRRAHTRQLLTTEQINTYRNAILKKTSPTNN
jgi:four helix bundle protein